MLCNKVCHSQIVIFVRYNNQILKILKEFNSINMFLFKIFTLNIIKKIHSELKLINFLWMFSPGSACFTQTFIPLRSTKRVSWPTKHRRSRDRLTT